MIFLVYGKDEDENLVHISESASGLGCGLSCPFCGGALVARKGRKVAHHFGHKVDSCKPALSLIDFIPSYEGYYNLGLTPTQRKALHIIINRWGDEPFHAEWNYGYDAYSVLRDEGLGRPKQVLDTLREKGFLVLVEEEQKGWRVSPVVKVTDKARAFACELSLLDFGRFMNLEFERVYEYLESKTRIDVNSTRAPTELLERERQDYEVALRMLEQERKRIVANYLYFIEIEAKDKQLYEHKRFYKVGITSRVVEERIGEIKTFLKKYYKNLTITALFYLDSVSFVEGYFKAKFRENRLEIGRATEYFDFEDVTAVINELERLTLLTDFHKERVKEGMAKARARGKKLGRPAKKEKVARFLKKPKSKHIAMLLKEGLGLREVQRRTGYSINTIRKVKGFLMDN